MIRAVPGLSEVVEHDGCFYWITHEGAIGTAFRTTVLDLEAEGGSVSTGLARFFKDLPTELICRIKTSSKLSVETGFYHPREFSLAQLGFVEHDSVVLFESKGNIGASALLRSAILPWKSRTSSFSMDQIKRFALLLPKLALGQALKVRPLSKTETESLFTYEDCQLKEVSWGIDSGEEAVGILRLHKTTTDELHASSFAQTRLNIPLPYEVVLTIEPMSKTQAELTLRKGRKSLKGLKDSFSGEKSEVYETTLSRLLVNELSLTKIEYLLILKRDSEGSLRRDLAEAKRALKQLGEVCTETLDPGTHYLASLPGGKPFCTRIENNEALACYAPVSAFGEVLQKPSRKNGALALHRRDNSLHFFNLFNPEYTNFNSVILGGSGKGKSVFVGHMTNALLDDPEVRVIKVDVGSSYRKECDLFGGKCVEFNVNEPSGQNPFSILTQIGHREDICQILASFLSSLILERNETYLPNETQASIETEVLKYSEKRPECPSISDFISDASGLPRLPLLKRWAKGGIYQKIFESSKNWDGSEQLTYFDFKDINQAASGDFAHGGMSAVFAWVNFQAILAKNVRIALICDEIPFFIKSNARLFGLTSANYRKLGHSCTFIAQSSMHLVLPGNDTGLFTNAATKVLFSVDGTNESEFMDRIGIDESDLTKLKSCEHLKGKVHEFLLSDSLGSRVVRVDQTLEEYWRKTSDNADKRRIEQLQESVFSNSGLKLSLQDAMRCLCILPR